MVYVVERYLPGLSRANLLHRLSRLEPVIEELRREGSVVRYLGSTIVLEDEACFCQFDGSSVAAVAEANRRADLLFDRIVPAVLVQPTHRSSDMSVSTSIPKRVTLRQSHFLAVIAAIVAVVALATWAITSRAAHSGTPSVRSSVPSEASVLRSLTTQQRQYVKGILSLTPAELQAAFGTSPTAVTSARGAGATHPTRASAPTVASVLRSLTPRERQYVLAITTLTPAKLQAGFGTNPTSVPDASPILPACGPGPCWRGATNTEPPAAQTP